MSSPSISTQLPDPFLSFPSTIAAPITRTVHVPSTQVQSTGGQLYASQLTSPLVLNITGNQTFTLPDAFTLSSALGNSTISPTYSGQINSYSALPSSQVQPGDTFVIRTYMLSTSSGTGSFTAGTGGTGSKPIPAWTSTANSADLVVQFTAVGYNNSTTSYTLQ